jgi:hypothetical protein
MPEIKQLWFEYNAGNMIKPSLDRLDSTKDYTYSNCRFIEYKLNALDGSKNAATSCSKKVFKYDLNKDFVQSFKSIGDAAKDTGNYNYKYSIAACCRRQVIKNKHKRTAYGFIWRFENDTPD